MQAYELKGTTGLNALSLVERKQPQPGPEEVLIEMRAASLNYRDLLVLSGLYPNTPLPLIPLSDGVGTVVAIGDRVTHVQPGDRVAGIFDQNWLSGEVPGKTSSLGGQTDGVLAQHIVLHQDGVVRVPAYLTDEEAATLPCAAVTAWNALMVRNHIKPGMTILIQGMGGVSLFALQFARMAGASVIAISASEQKLLQAHRLGAEETVNYQRTPDWDQEILKLTGGKGVDVVVEVGGTDTLPRSINAVRRGGQISLIGLATGANAQFFIPSLLMKQVRIQGTYVGSRSTFEQMNAAITEHHIRPVIDRVFPFKDAHEAYRYLESGAHVGKICVRF